MPTHPSGGAPRIETLIENVADKSASYLPGRIVKTPHREEETPVTARINVAWREATAPIVSTVLGEEDWHAVEHVWQPEHCESLEAVATALDDVWASAVPMAEVTTVVLRVVGLAALVAALVVEVVERSVKTAYEPIPLTGELLRLTGIAICGGTENAVTCGRLRQELEAVTEVPDQRMVRLLEGGLRRALTATTSDITINDFLRRLDTPRVQMPDEVEPPMEEPTGPIGRSRVATAKAVDGPSRVAAFGQSWLPRL